MKKIEFIEAIRKSLRTNADPYLVGFYIGRAMNQIIYDTFRRDISNIDIYAHTYKNIAVEEDTDQDIYYSKLPVSIVQLPISGDGVLSIHSMKGYGVEFAAKRAELNHIHKNLEVSSINGPIPYWINSGRVEYGKKPMIGELDKVMMRIIPDFGKLDMLDDIYIPTGKDVDVINITRQFLGDLPYDDTVNDNNEKTR